MALVTLDFNLEDVKDSFELLPTDAYEAKITKQELKKSAAGNNMIAIEWTVLTGDFAGRKVFDNIVLMEATAWKVKQYAELIGLESGSTLDPELFMGVEAILGIVCRDQTAKEKDQAKAKGYDAEAQKNDIKKITKIG